MMPPADLDTIRARSLDLSAAGADDRRSAFHTPAVATADGDARIMVLRAFDRARWTLRFHTDARAPKVAVIGGDAPVGVLFYDREDSLQLRCRGTGRIVREGREVDSAWTGSSEYARRCYLGDPPGMPAGGPSSGRPDWVEGEKPTEAQLEPARPNFALLVVELDEIDWYHLAHDGHRRALLTRDGGRWITP